MVGAVKKRATVGGSNSHSYVSTTTSSSALAQMKFRPSVQLETTRRTAKGTKPLPDPETVPEVLTRVILYGCKRILFVEAKYRLTFYAILLFIISLIGDYFPIPKSYFSNSENIPNQYFVKLSWAWTLTLTSAFVYFTTSVTCCGNRKLILRHFSRLVIATIIWYIWTNLFSIIEESTGQCIFTKNMTSSGAASKDTITVYSKTRKACKAGGGKWTSFDISGHSFLLMWCVLFITEECRAIIDWDKIPHLIRNEDYRRKVKYSIEVTSSIEENISDTPISHLTFEEFEALKISFSKFNVWAKVSLIVLTGLTVLWDCMLIATACYFHIMVEKIIAGLLAAMIWFFTYKGFYKMDHLSFSPGLPGVGYFKYSTSTPGSNNSNISKLYSAAGPAREGPSTSTRSKTNISKDSSDIPKFLGMPLNPLMKNPRAYGREGITKTLEVSY